MTAIMCSLVLYRCDDCGAEEDGTTARLPKGWAEGPRFTVVNTIGDPDTTTWTCHSCPKCVPPEAKS